MEEQCRYIFSKGDLFQKDFSIDFKSINKNVYIPIKNIKELYVFNDTTITTKLLELFGKYGICLHIFDYYGNYTGTFYPREQFLSGKLIVEQCLTYNDYSKRVEISKNIVNGIAKNVAIVLYHYYKHNCPQVKPTIDYCKKDVPRLLNKVNTIEQIMNVEGTIWMKFYDSFQYFLPNDFLMNGRNKRPPKDPINALISFCNSILYTKTISQLYETHLDQRISFLHSVSDGRFSLSLDISETFKPLICYKTIFYLINNKKIQVKKHFEKNLNYCILNDIGKKIVVEELDRRLNTTFYHSKLKRQVSYRHAIKLDGYKLEKTILEGKDFVPFNEEEKQ